MRGKRRGEFGMLSLCKRYKPYKRTGPQWVLATDATDSHGSKTNRQFGLAFLAVPFYSITDRNEVSHDYQARPQHHDGGEWLVDAEPGDGQGGG